MFGSDRTAIRDEQSEPPDALAATALHGKKTTPIYRVKFQSFLDQTHLIGTVLVWCGARDGLKAVSTNLCRTTHRLQAFRLG